MEAFVYCWTDKLTNKHDNDGFYFEGWKKGEMTLEHREKLSAAKKGKKLSKEHHAKLIASGGRKGKKNSPKHKAALLASRIGSKHSEKSKTIMSEKRKKNPEVKKLASLAGLASVAARPSNYKELHSARMKLWWAERRSKMGG